MTATATKRGGKKAADGWKADRATFLQALQDVKAAIPTRSPRPVLQNVMLAGGVLTASDLELQIEASIDYYGDPLLLPHAKLYAIVYESKADEVTLAVDGSVCVVTAGRGTWRLPLGDPAEWPTWNPTDEKHLIRMPCDQFRRAVSATCHSTDNESSRYALGGVCIEAVGEECNFVATDGRRLSLFKCRREQAYDDGHPLVPAKAMTAMSVLAKGDSNAIQIDCTQREVIATTAGRTVTARLLEGRFPRWRDTLKRDESKTKTETVVSAKELHAATSVAAIVTSEQSKGVDFTFGREGVTLHGQSSEWGTSDVSIDAVIGSTPVRIKLDPQFVLEWLKPLTGGDDDPNVTVELVDPQSACILRSGEDCTGVIMPLAAD